MRCDPTLVALPALAVCGGMVGMTRTVRLKASWCEPAVIWAVVVGNSGTLKTPPYKRAVAPVIALQVAALKPIGWPWRRTGPTSGSMSGGRSS